jgi:hypothetical protein
MPDLKLNGGVSIGTQSVIGGDPIVWTNVFVHPALGPLDLTLYGSDWRASLPGAEVDESDAADGSLTLRLSGDATAALIRLAKGEAVTVDFTLAPSRPGLIAFEPLTAALTVWRGSHG